ncbi:hypothetical protein LX36DRAFT_689974 [Colletotrichum falcatum]|nr:hypothetical protein LX36DRAFT_689974 [Colletotrichum falcatum]
MAELATPTPCRRLRRLLLRFCGALENTHLLREVLERRQKPAPSPGVPYPEDEPAWGEYLDRKARENKEEEEKGKEETENPSPGSEQDRPSEDLAFGVVYSAIEFSVAAAPRLLDFEKGLLVVRNPNRASLMPHDVSERPAASGDDGSRDFLHVCVPDLDGTLPDEGPETSDTPLPSQESASPSSPIRQPLDLGEGRGRAPPCDSREVCPDGHAFFWPPETARVAVLLHRVQPRLVSVPPPSLPPSASSPAPFYRTSLSQDPRRRGMIFPSL